MQPVDSGLTGVKDMNWPHDGICFVHVPRSNPIDNAIWDHVLQGISLTN